MRNDPAEALHVVQAPDRNVHVGKDAAEWLVERGVVHYQGFSADAGHMYKTAVKAAEVNELVMANPDTRPCDVCHVSGARWAMHVRPFFAAMGPHVARFERDVVMCADCARLVTANDKAGLVERGVRGAIDLAQRQGGMAAGVVRTQPRQTVERHIRPMVRETIARLAKNRRGAPFELT